MRYFDRALSVTLAAASAVFVWPAITDGAPAVVEPSTTLTRTTIAKSLSRVSPPLAGIKLLEDIFQKMHSLPQLAMNSKITPLIAYQNQAANSNFQQSLTDPNLSIKPRQAARRMKSASERGVTVLDDRTIVRDFRGGSGSASDAAAMPKQQDGTKSLAFGAMAQSSISGGGAGVGGYPSAGKSRAMPVAATAEPLLDEEHAAAFKPMSVAVRNLYGITNQISKAQSAADNLSSSANGMEYAKKAMARASTLAKEKDKATPYQSVAISPNITEIRRESKSSQAAVLKDLVAAAPQGAMRQDEFANSQALQSAAPASTPAPAQDQKEMVLEQPGIYKYMHEYSKTKPGQPKPPEVAMNAPNVVTGIPLVHLGALASDAKSALASRYKVKEQQMEGWTVCTGIKPRESDAAIQLYLKHGMVEAMRVFDRSLLSGELGVGLGDNLQSMKSQFGEPAFIIHEPTPSASPTGQNYVYPISQVCFQLARTGKDAPRVVSVLIFNDRRTSD